MIRPRGDLDMISRAYVFGEFSLDLVRRKLLRDETEVKLNDNEFDLLRYLIENSPNVCSFEEIVEHVWKGTSVGNNSVEKVIVGLRKALEDDSKSPQYIKTRRGRGYVFIGLMTEKGNEKRRKRYFVAREPIASRYWIYLSVVFVGLLALAYAGRLHADEILELLHDRVLISDDFSSDKIDSRVWVSMGNSVQISDGNLVLRVDETDNPGTIYSKFLTIDPNKKVKIKSRLKISFSRNIKNQNFFGGVFGFVQKSDQLDNFAAHQDTDAENRRFTGLRYMNYDSETVFLGYDGEKLQETPTEGFFIVKDGGRPNARAEYQAGLISDRIEPIWDKWFEQKIEYDPVTGKMSYFIDGAQRGEFDVGRLKAEDDQIRLQILPWGWWVNHSMSIGYITVTQ